MVLFAFIYEFKARQVRVKGRFDNSPALQRWESDATKIIAVKWATDTEPLAVASGQRCSRDPLATATGSVSALVLQNVARAVSLT